MHLKRLFDLAISFLALLLALPLLVLLTLQVRINLGSPIFFKQSRPGLHSKIFSIYKFRSMADVRGEDGSLLSDTERLSDFGRFLRSTSLDELPELWNVIKGDMSLVGPRPLLKEYMSLYSLEQLRRHEVRPGVSGWAQVNGRNAITWEEKFKYDVWYVENQSFWLDMKIIWMTIKKVFAREGISADGEATMPKFTGNKE
jgi:lipopolysaccharide/colanic/teichoic acid biosynthesis glycosyltransferase